MNREEVQTTPGYSSHEKRRCSWARITHSAPVTLQFFKRDLIPPSICWQPAGDPHKPGLVLFEARPISGVGGDGPTPLPVAATGGTESHSTRAIPSLQWVLKRHCLPCWSWGHPLATSRLPSTLWSSHPLGHLLFNGFMPFQDCFFVPDKLILKMFMNIYKTQVKDATTTSLQWPSSIGEAPLP